MNTKIASIFCAAVFIAACGPNEDNNTNVITANNTQNNNTNNMSTNMSTNNSSNNSNGATNVVTNNPNEGCPVEEINDIGAMSVDLSEEFNETNAILRVSCAETVGEIATNGSYVLKLQYPEETTVTIGIEGIATEGTPPRPGAELRRGGCETGSVVFCDTASSYTETLDANVPYFLVINGLLQSGGVRVTVDSDAQLCTPNESTCADGVVSTCNALGDGTEETACPGDCDGPACAGDACTAPIVVSPTADGPPVVLEGNRSTFTATWDAMGGAGCDLGDGAPAPDTPGPEMFLQVQGVTAGQTVVLDADQSTLSYGFFVIESCTATTCLAAYEFDSTATNRGMYTAPADSDVLVAVEAFGDVVDRDFVIEVSLTNP